MADPGGGSTSHMTVARWQWWQWWQWWHSKESGLWRPAGRGCQPLLPRLEERSSQLQMVGGLMLGGLKEACANTLVMADPLLTKKMLLL